MQKDLDYYPTKHVTTTSTNDANFTDSFKFHSKVAVLSEHDTKSSDNIRKYFDISVKPSKQLVAKNGDKDTSVDMEVDDDASESSEMTSNTMTSAIYRYKFSKKFMDQLFVFSKVHEYDDRHSFKEAWHVWKDEHSELVQDEIERLTQLGYTGDVLSKMFKSARYYFRKKDVQKKETTKRRNYITLRKEMLHAMDLFIVSNLDLKPSVGFDCFCKEHVPLLKEELMHLYKNNMTDSEEMKNKIKKTYKNRYFLCNKAL